MDYRNIIIASHSKRLRQFISLYFNNFIRKLRFKNCAILKIYFNMEVLKKEKLKNKFISHFMKT